MEVIRTDSISKKFDRTIAANNISISVNQGEVYGLLGLNGAGKTTLIRILLRMVKTDSGSVYLFGNKLTPKFDLWNKIGYLVETPHAYPNLSVKDNFSIYFELRQLEDTRIIHDIIEKLQLTDYKNTKSRYLSLGNKQRLGLAKALLHKPRLLILDEPISGLDPEGIIEIRKLLKVLAKNGITVLPSSHNLEEISKVANRIGIIHNGSLIKELSTEELKKQLRKKLQVNTLNNTEAFKIIRESNRDALLNAEGVIEIYDPDSLTHSENISKLLVEFGFPPKEISIISESLEAYFLRIIGQ